MKEVIAIIRMNMMNQTKQALTEAGVRCVHRPRSHGRGKGIVDYPDPARRRGRVRGGHRQLGATGQALSQTDDHRRGPDDDCVETGGRDDHRRQPDGQARRRQDFRAAGQAMQSASARAKLEIKAICLTSPRRRQHGNCNRKQLVQWEPADVKEELLKKYPPKVARKRAKQILINEARRTPPRRSPPTSAPSRASSPSAAAPMPAARAW